MYLRSFFSLTLAIEPLVALAVASPYPTATISAIQTAYRTYDLSVITAFHSGPFFATQVFAPSESLASTYTSFATLKVRPYLPSRNLLTRIRMLMLPPFTLRASPSRSPFLYSTATFISGSTTLSIPLGRDRRG